MAVNYFESGRVEWLIGEGPAGDRFFRMRERDILKHDR